MQRDDVTSIAPAAAPSDKNSVQNNARTAADVLRGYYEQKNRQFKEEQAKNVSSR